MQMTLKKLSVVRSSLLAFSSATACSTVPAVQIPCASSPARRPIEKAVSRAAAPCAGSESNAPPGRSRAAFHGQARMPSRPGGRGQLRRLGGPAGAAGQAVAVDAVRRRSAHVASTHHRQLHGHIVDRRGLRRAVGREAQHDAALAHHPGETVAVEAASRQLSDLQRAHATPTSTLRKRAGAEPCDTCIIWPGSPLPQSSSEVRRHSGAEQTASQLPQNSGVTPL